MFSLFCLIICGDCVGLYYPEKGERKGEAEGRSEGYFYESAYLCGAVM